MTVRASASPAQSDTARRILDIAERLVQTRGFNGFSYADISSELGITKASLHHHFATKAELGRALIARYSEEFAGALRALDGEADAFAKLERYAKLYEDVLCGQRLCLCGVLAAEYGTLPKPMQEEIRRFFAVNETWLATVVEEGRKAKVFHRRGSAQDVARMVLGTLEGAMLVTRPFKDVERFAAAVRQLLSGLTETPRTRRPSG